MKKYLILSLILGIDVLVLLYETSQLSIGYSEILLLHAPLTAVKFLENISFYCFGHNDYALRLPMILLHVGSALLLFRLSSKYLKRDSDRLWLVGVFVLLPGVMSSAIIVNGAGFVIFGLLLYLNFYEKHIGLKYLLLLFFLFCDQSFMLLFAGLLVYAMRQKDKKFVIFNFLLLILSLYIYGFNTTGLPKGHFLDTLAIYSAIFTPIVFIYIFYILYRRYITSKEDMLWYLASTSFVLSLLISFRQRLHLEMFAPYVIIALPIAAQTFFQSYRVRLKQFRGKYKTIFIIAFSFLLINATLIIFNKYLYYVIKNPKEHFAYNMQIAKDLADKLHGMQIGCIDANNYKMQARLHFYGITKCESPRLINHKIKNSKKVTISYKGKEVYKKYVTKINKK